MDQTGRFTNRAQYYARNRPGYPDEVLLVLEREVELTPRTVIADIGAGTGISSEFFLRNGNPVVAIEPNADMRVEALRLIEKYPAFRLIEATAEETTLSDASVDLVVAATAFHWFDHDRCRSEFRRILKPGGYVVLLWNERATGPGFLDEYEQLLMRFGWGYKKSGSRQRVNIVEECTRFFAPAPLGFHQVRNLQALDGDGLYDRLLSTSYSPLPGDPDFDPMVRALRELFDKFQRDGKVVMEYETGIYWGQLLTDIAKMQ